MKTTYRFGKEYDDRQNALDEALIYKWLNKINRKNRKRGIKLALIPLKERKAD